MQFSMQFISSHFTDCFRWMRLSSAGTTNKINWRIENLINFERKTSSDQLTCSPGPTRAPRASAATTTTTAAAASTASAAAIGSRMDSEVSTVALEADEWVTPRHRQPVHPLRPPTWVRWPRVTWRTTTSLSTSSSQSCWKPTTRTILSSTSTRSTRPSSFPQPVLRTTRTCSNRFHLVPSTSRHPMWTTITTGPVWMMITTVAGRRQWSRLRRHWSSYCSNWRVCPRNSLSPSSGTCWRTTRRSNISRFCRRSRRMATASFRCRRPWRPIQRCRRPICTIRLPPIMIWTFRSYRPWNISATCRLPTPCRRSPCRFHPQDLPGTWTSSVRNNCRRTLCRPTAWRRPGSHPAKSWSIHLPAASSRSPPSRGGRIRRHASAAALVQLAAAPCALLHDEDEVAQVGPG